jgi:hypothetical protein
MHRSCHNLRVKNERENAAKPGFFHDRRKKWFEESSSEMKGCTLERTGRVFDSCYHDSGLRRTMLTIETGR